MISKLNTNSNYVEEVKEITQNSYNQKSINNSQSILNSQKRENTTSVDDLPEILNISRQNRPTMKNHQPKKVFRNIVNNI